MKQKLILLALVIGLTIVSQSSFSLGMGKIQVYSALDEPLRSSIDLFTNADEELVNLNVKLASSEDYQKVGLDKSFVPANILVGFDEENPYQINVTSNGPVTEPIVSLLLDVNWNNGRILREFTVLLDPPVYDTIGSDIQVNQALVEPMEDNSIQTDVADESTAVDDSNVSTDAVETSPGIEPVENETTTYTNEDLVAYEEAAEPEVSYESNPDTVVVESGDTLWRIANQNKIGDLSAQQMMMAIYNSNPSAFIDNNINQLIKGSTLNIPSANEANSIGFSEAMAQVESHHNSWAPAQQEYSSYQTESTTADVVEEEPSSLDYGVQLSGNDSDGSDSGQSNSDDGTAAEVQAMEEDLYNQTSENSELKERISELEGIVEQQQDAIVIQDDDLSNLENQLANADDIVTDEIEGVDETTTLDDIWDSATEGDSSEDLSLVVDSVDTEDPTEVAVETAEGDSGEDGAGISSDAQDTADAEVVAADESEPTTVSPPKFAGVEEQSFVDTSINWVMDNLKWVLMGLVGLILLIFLPRALRSNDTGDDESSFLDDIKSNEDSVDEGDVDEFNINDQTDAETKMNEPLELEAVEEVEGDDDVLAELDKSIVFDETENDDAETAAESETQESVETDDFVVEDDLDADDGFDVDGFLNDDDEDNNTSVTADHSATLADVAFEDDADEESTDDEDLDFDDIDLDFDEEIEDLTEELEEQVDEVVEDASDAIETVSEDVEEAVDSITGDQNDEEEFSFDEDFDFDLDEELEELEHTEEMDSSEDQDASNSDAETVEEEFNDMLDISDDEEETFEIIEEDDVDMDEEIDLGLEDLMEDSDAIGTKLDLAKAYIDMGDSEGAKNLLNEVFAEGTEEQITEAKKLLDDM